MKNSIPLPNAKSVGARGLTPPAQRTSTAIEFRPPQDEVARRAYSIYLDHGSPQGRDVQHWLEAESQAIAARESGRASVIMETKPERPVHNSEYESQKQLRLQGAAMLQDRQLDP